MPFRQYDGDRDRLLSRVDEVLSRDPIGEINAFGASPWVYNAAITTGTTGTGSIGSMQNGVLGYQSGSNPRREFNQTTSGLSGISLETNPVIQRLRNTDTMTTNWVATNLTVSAVNAVGPDGLTSAVTLTTSATPATLVQNRGVVAGQKRFTVWLRRVSGSGTVRIAANTGAYVTVTVTSTWQRFYAYSTLDAVAGIELSSSPSYVQQVIEVFAPTLYAGNPPTRAMEIINPTAADLTRGADICTIASGLSGWINEGTAVLEACPQRGIQFESTENAVIEITKDAVGIESAYIAMGWSAGSTTDIYIADGVLYDYSFTATDATYTPIKRIAMSWNSSRFRWSVNGSGVTSVDTTLWSAIANAPWAISCQGCSLRYAAVYRTGLDAGSIRDLSRLMT